jgi:hypothetical protein
MGARATRPMKKSSEDSARRSADSLQVTAHALRSPKKMIRWRRFLTPGSRRGAAPTERRAHVCLAGACRCVRALRRAARHAAVCIEPTVGDVREVLDRKGIRRLDEDATLTARRGRGAVGTLLAGVRGALQLPIELGHVLRLDHVAHRARAGAALTSTAASAAACRHRAAAGRAARSPLRSSAAGHATSTCSTTSRDGNGAAASDSCACACSRLHAGCRVRSTARLACGRPATSVLGVTTGGRRTATSDGAQQQRPPSAIQIRPRHLIKSNAAPGRLINFPRGRNRRATDRTSGTSEAADPPS